MGIDMGIGIVMGCDGYPDDVEPGGEGIGTGMATCPCPYTGFGWLVVVVAVVVVVVPFPPGPGYAGGVYVPCARAAGSVSTLSASVPGVVVAQDGRWYSDPTGFWPACAAGRAWR
jgi:hypothetical protein